jgi:hypothetical protein
MLLCRTGRGDEGSKLLKKAVSDNPKILSLLKSTEDEINAGCFKSSK